jgi:hypothetical protein
MYTLIIVHFRSDTSHYHVQLTSAEAIYQELRTLLRRCRGLRCSDFLALPMTWLYVTEDRITTSTLALGKSHLMQCH